MANTTRYDWSSQIGRFLMSCTGLTGAAQLVAQLAVFTWLVGAADLVAGTLTAELDKNSGVEGDEFSLTLRVQGSIRGEPQFQEVQGVEISGSGRSTNVSMINGSFSKETVFSYVLMPSGVGEFQIPTITLNVDDEVLKTVPLSFKVGKLEVVDGERPPLFVEREFSKMAPYVGEPIVATIRIFHKVQLEQAQPKGKTSEEFRYIPLEGEGHSRRQIGNDVYEVITLNKILVPLASGPKVIPPYVLDTVIFKPSRRSARRDPFWGMLGGRSGRRVRKRVASQVSNLDVKPLPADAKPANFQGIVGRFALQVTLSDNSLKVGETATLTVKVSGQGILDNLGNLELDLGNKVKIYADKPEVHEESNEKIGVYSRRIYKFALVPTAPGTIALGQFKLPIFDPESGSYRILSKAMGELRVTPSDSETAVVVTANGENSSASKTGVKALAQDLIDIHRHVDLTENHALVASDGMNLGMIAGVPFGLLFLVFGASRVRRSSGDEQKKRRAMALRSFKAGVKSAQSLGDAQESLLSAFKAYRVYFGEKFGSSGAGVTAKEIELCLSRANLESVVPKARELASQIEKLAYSGQSSAVAGNQELIELMEMVVDAVEKGGKG